jgi:predicted nuclease with TOPRIM domain
MSYKDELKKQIEQLENQVDSDKERLKRLYQELSSVNMRERTEQLGEQQLLQG